MDRRTFIASSFAALAAPGALLNGPVTFRGVPLVFVPTLSSWKNWTCSYADPHVTHADIIACWRRMNEPSSEG